MSCDGELSASISGIGRGVPIKMSVSWKAGQYSSGSKVARVGSALRQPQPGSKSLLRDSALTSENQNHAVFLNPQVGVATSLDVVDEPGVTAWAVLTSDLLSLLALAVAVAVRRPEGRRRRLRPGTLLWT